MKVQISAVSEWNQVEEAADAATTCIRLSTSTVTESPGANWLKAKRTWETFGLEDPKLVRYFLICDGAAKSQGYIRLFQVDKMGDKRYPVWVVDYANPFTYAAVVLCAEALGGIVMTKEVHGADDIVLSHKWPRIPLAFPELNRFLYTVQRPDESIWIMVP